MKKRAGMFVVDVNGNTCCVIRSLPYDNDHTNADVVGIVPKCQEGGDCQTNDVGDCQPSSDGACTGRITTDDGRNCSSSTTIKFSANRYTSFLEMIQIPRGSKERFDTDLMYTAVREFYEETLCANNTFEVFKEPFTLYWDDGGKRWTYYIYIAFIRDEPLYFSFRPNYISVVNILLTDHDGAYGNVTDFDVNGINVSVCCDRSLGIVRMKSKLKPIPFFPPILRKPPSSLFLERQLWRMSSVQPNLTDYSYIIYTTELSKSTSGSYNSIVILHVRDYIHYMKNCQLVYYENSNYNAFFDKVQDCLNTRRDLSVDNLNMNSDIYSSIVNNRESYSKPFDRNVYLSFDRSKDMKKCWTNWWKIRGFPNRIGTANQRVLPDIFKTNGEMPVCEASKRLSVTTFEFRTS